MSRNDICAVLPAAGRGSRLGLDVPKLCAPIHNGMTVWSIMRPKLLSTVDRIHLIVAPQWKKAFESLLANDPEWNRLSVSVQTEPRGMGDAIFGAYSHWADSHTLLVVWGDQIHISNATLHKAIARNRQSAGPSCTIPVVQLDRPYVQYCFDDQDQLQQIRETREGAVCDERGYSDVGTFALDVAGLDASWRRYSEERIFGARTGETNFLPFLPYLARNGWQVRHVPVSDPLEARGINNAEDLRFFQTLYASGNA
jgi:bifunctional UDP-N-acetylglucosamine pyrophosphorylase/glucosamine-1-phosphate N-acetyltransferase